MKDLWLDIYTKATDVKIFKVYDIQYTMTARDLSAQVAIMDVNESLIDRILGETPRKVVIRDDDGHEFYRNDNAIIDVCPGMYFGFMRLNISSQEKLAS